MTKLALVLAALTLCSGCGHRITGPHITDASGEDIHGEGHTLAEYIAIVEALKANPDSYPEGWTQ